MQFPILKTPRLALKPISYKDATALFNLLSQYEVCLYNNFSVLDNKAQAQDLIQQDLENSYNNIGIRYAINNNVDEFIGSCGVHEYNASCRTAIIGYELDPKYWKKGFMIEAVNYLIAYLFSDSCHFVVNKINANVLNLNIASIKLLTKLGFVKCENNINNNDILQYQLTKSIWKNNNLYKNKKVL